MTESVKNRIGGAHQGPMFDKEVGRLLQAVRSDLLNLALDLANVQIVLNNVGSAVGNIKTNCSNATVNINAVTLKVVASGNLNTQV